MFREDGDTENIITQPTPTSEIILGNLEVFTKKWNYCLSNGSTNAINNIKKHIIKGCCSEIHVGAGTNRNERLHKTLKKSLLGGASTVSPELASAVFTLILYIWNMKRDPQARKHSCNARVIPVLPLELTRQCNEQSTSCGPNLSSVFKTGKC